MKMKFKITLLLYGLCTVVALGQTVLKYDLKEGEVFTIKQTAEQVITQELDVEKAYTNEFLPQKQ